MRTLVRFVIIGLPRSGTTYLMSLLNAHPDVFCSGEQFNPYAIVGIEADKVEDFDTVVARDINALAFFDDFFERNQGKAKRAIGFKFMIGHNISVLDHIIGQPDLRLIHVHRANKLAQATSFMRAVQSQVWAISADAPEEPDTRKLAVGPRAIGQQVNEFATTDMLFAHWFASLPHPRLTVEYRDMFSAGFVEKLCDFIEVPQMSGLTGQLKKQGVNTILDRFVHRGAIADYFTRTGHADWLGDEL